jgi:type VI secretion system protein ImpC
MLDLAPPVEPMAASGTPPPTPRERLERFWGAASPTARRLAGLLAASPAITLPVIRLVRQALLPEARQVHEAEVLLGGLLRIADPPGQIAQDPDEVRYDFRDGLRTLLLDAVPAADALEVLRGVSAYVEENLAQGVDFRAMLADPAAARGSIVPAEGPFARVAAEVLLRLGGDYARLVTALPEGQPSGPAAGSSTTGSPPGRTGQAPPLGSHLSLPGAPPPPPARLREMLDGVRKPRVQITYDVEHDGVIEKRELPFVICVLADLSGHPSRHVHKPTEYEFVEIDRDNFDEVMRRIAPRLAFTVKGLFSDSNPDGWMLANRIEIPLDEVSLDSDPQDVEVALSFRGISDFNPGWILDQHPQFKRIFEAKEKRLLLAKEHWYFFNDPSMLEFIKHENVAIDKTINIWLREILHHPDFQRLEATWSGLHYLVNQTNTGPMLKIRVLNVSKRDLARDQERSIEFDQSALFAGVYKHQFGVIGGEPFGLLLGDFAFDRSDADLALLQGISLVAAAAHAPFVAATHPSMLYMDSFEEMSDLREIPKAFDGPQSERWREFRDSNESRFVALVLPRFLGRLPYGAKSLPVEYFPLEEWDGPPPHEGYLWMNSAWALAARIAQSVSTHGWPSAIRGKEDGLVPRLPVHVVTGDQGGHCAVGPVEIAIGDRREYLLAAAGLTALVPAREGDSAMFLSTPTCHRPRLFDQPEAAVAEVQAAELNAVLCVSRLVHYLMILGRDKTAMLSGAAGIQALLNAWLRGYISDDPEASDETRSRYPLVDARVEVEDAHGRPGYFRVVLHIKLALYPKRTIVGSRAEFQISGNVP